MKNYLPTLRLIKLRAMIGLITVFAMPLLHAEGVKPFVLAASSNSDSVASVVSKTRSQLSASGFDIIGQYAPYKGAEVIVFSSKKLRQTATQSKRGGYAAALRAAVTSNNGTVELAYTNPVYWANAYRLNESLEDIAKQLQTVLGNQQSFGTGEQVYSAEDMREYHYTFMMEYFDDPSVLGYFDSHQQAVSTIAQNLKSGVAGANLVYQLDLGKDINGVAMTLFGVGLTGAEDDCGSDAYIMNRIDRSNPRHTAHLPYEILVYGNNVEALYARFRIAISWPHLPMVSSDTGATFFSIMCAPGAIEDKLTLVAGGSLSIRKTGDK